MAAYSGPGSSDGPWVNLPPFGASVFDPANPVQVMKDSRGVVHLRGIVTNIDPSTCFVGPMPNAYRPRDTVVFFTGALTIHMNANANLYGGVAGAVVLDLREAHWSAYP